MFVSKKKYVFIIVGFILMMLLYFRSRANEYSRKSYIQAVLSVEIVRFYQLNGKYPQVSEILILFDENQELKDDVSDIGYVIYEKKAIIHWQVFPYQGRFLCFFEGELLFDSTVGQAEGVKRNEILNTG